MSILKNKIFRSILIFLGVILLLPIICYVVQAINGLGKIVGTYIRYLGTI